MNKSIVILTTVILVLSSITGCGKKDEAPMVDMDTIQTDGSHDNKYIFRKELEKEERREKKYKKNEF